MSKNLTPNNISGMLHSFPPIVSTYPYLSTSEISLSLSVS